MQRTAVAAGGELTVRLRRLTAGFVSHHANERVQAVVVRVDSPETRLGEFRRTKLAPPELTAELIDRSGIPHCRSPSFAAPRCRPELTTKRRRGAPSWTCPQIGVDGAE